MFSNSSPTRSLASFCVRFTPWTRTSCQDFDASPSPSFSSCPRLSLTPSSRGFFLGIFLSHTSKHLIKLLLQRVTIRLFVRTQSLFFPFSASFWPQKRDSHKHNEHEESKVYTHSSCYLFGSPGSFQTRATCTDTFVISLQGFVRKIHDHDFHASGLGRSKIFSSSSSSSSIGSPVLGSKFNCSVDTLCL